MLDKTTEMVGRIVDGKLCAKVGKIENVFVRTIQEVKRLEEEITRIKERHDKFREEYILPTFRKAMTEYENTYGLKPTMVLMNYADVSAICGAYNAESNLLVESKAITGRREQISLYGSDELRIVDGIKVKQGCDQEPGDIRIYQFV